VREDQWRQWAIDRVTTIVESELAGAEIISITESPIHSPKGNVEYLLGLNKTT